MKAENTQQKKSPFNLDTVKGLSLDPVGKELAKSYLQIKAAEMVIIDQIKPIQDDCVEFWKLQPSKEFSGPKWEGLLNDQNYKDGRLTWKGLYLAEESDYKLLLKDYAARYKEAGFKMKSDDHCPQLVAESATRAAESLFIEYCAEFLGMPEIPYKHRKGFLDLNLKLIVSAMSAEELEELKTPVTP